MAFGKHLSEVVKNFVSLNHPFTARNLDVVVMETNINKVFAHFALRAAK